MKQIYFALVFCLVYTIEALNLPGPLVYVVTPSPKPPQQEGRAAPFYYNNWMRRMDSPNITIRTTTLKPTIKTPDLIFAEFESDSDGDMQKSLRKLLNKERIESKTSTTAKPIYVPDDPEMESSSVPSYGLPFETTKTVKLKENDSAMEDYFSQYNNIYNAQAPVYLPSTTVKSIISTTPAITTTKTTPAAMNVENIWHIIDNEKQNRYTGNWEEIPINESEKTNNDPSNDEEKNDEDDKFNNNFALPGFSTKGADNESRAIRNEQNIRFPYVDLKTFQMKKPQKTFLNSKKGNNMYTNLDNFQDIKNPVRWESQDIVPKRDQVDRYNPAQPYLPSYGTKSKQSDPAQSVPVKAVANLIPPPPPPPPPQSSDSLLPPSTYDSFPPYALPDSASMASPDSKPSKNVFQSQAGGVSYDFPPSDSSDDGPVMDLGYRYKPPSPPSFVPTIPPVTMTKPSSGYSYAKPLMDMDDSLPSPPFKGYSYKTPAIMEDAPPASPPYKGYSYDKPPMNDGPVAFDSKPQYGGYNYNKPPTVDHDTPSLSYGHDAHIYGDDSHYPELIFNKPHGGSGDMKGGDDMKASDMGMMPPPPPADMKPDLAGPPDDHGFPHDFPGDFKYHDFDDHDHYHHHHHHTTTTTTTTTETPRVNRYSYYYLGKKLYYLPLYFSVYFIIYVGALILKAVLRHKIVYPNSWRPNDTTSTFFSKRSVDSWDLTNENLHEITGRVTKALGNAAEKYMSKKTSA